MERTRFFEKVIVDNRQQHDFLFHTLSNFKIKNQVTLYRVDSTDILRPDLISFKNYGNVKFWWFILFVNGIQDPFKDIKVGMLLEIPDLLDFFDFSKKFKLR